MKTKALATFLGEDPEDIREVDGLYEVFPRMTKRGTSPEEIEARAALLHQALEIVGMDTDHHLQLQNLCLKEAQADTCYNIIQRLFRENKDVQPLLQVGTHDLLNTLYFVLGGKTASRYSDDIRVAFDGLPVTDRRESVHTNSGEYLVLTNKEADERQDESLDSYIDDCLEIPDAMKSYFDRESWKRDARMGGRGSLPSYDGCENTQEVDGEWFYIYRVN